MLGHIMVQSQHVRYLTSLSEHRNARRFYEFDFAFDDANKRLLVLSVRTRWGLLLFFGMHLKSRRSIRSYMEIQRVLFKSSLRIHI